MANKGLSYGRNPVEIPRPHHLVLPILARFSSPFLKVNPILTKVADCRACLLLKRGYLALPANRMAHVSCHKEKKLLFSTRRRPRRTVKPVIY